MPPRTLAASATRLPDPVEVTRDYSRHPIPGQLAFPIPAGQNQPAKACPSATEHCTPSDRAEF